MFYAACIILALSTRRCLAVDFSDSRTVNLAAVRRMVIAGGRAENVSARVQGVEGVQWWIDWNMVAVDRISMTVLMCVVTAVFALLLMVVSLQVPLFYPQHTHTPTLQFTKATSDARKYEEELQHEQLLKAQAEPQAPPAHAKPWHKPAASTEEPDKAAKPNVCPVCTCMSYTCRTTWP